MAAALTLEGDKELMIQFRGLPNAVQKKLLGRALKLGAEVVLSASRNIAPVDSGALRDGLAVWKVKRQKNRWGFGVFTPTRQELAKGQPTAEKAQAVYNGAGYYPAVMEFGSAKCPPHPYLRPALEMSESQVLALCAQDIREALNGKPRAEGDDGDSGGIDPDSDVAPDAPIHTGKRGGRYRLSRTGKKVYVSRWSFGDGKA